MTKINIYCLFDKDDNFHGVYSSLKAIHRDAVILCSNTSAPVYIRSAKKLETPSLRLLRNIFKGQMDVHVEYFSQGTSAKILKTKLIE
jgi:hypothetical protein